MSDSAGALIAANAYDPYGVAAAANVGRFQYTGQIALPELGLYHYKARVYSPTLGRFLQTDPVGYVDDLNLYAYVRNDPLNGSDPTGRRLIFVGGGGDGYPRGSPGRHTIVKDYSDCQRSRELSQKLTSGIDPPPARREVGQLQ